MNPESSAAANTRRVLPRRDLLLLPLTALLTLVLFFSITEGLARKIWWEQEKDGCALAGGVLGIRGRPNCSMVMKNPEGPAITYKLNECGYRSNTPCGPKPAGTFRLVVLGTSAAQSWYVPYDKMFANLAAERLGQACRRRVDVQTFWGDLTLPEQYRLMDEVLALHPDAIVFATVPYDLQRFDGHPIPPKKGFQPTQNTKVTWASFVVSLLKESRAALVARHYLLQNDAMLYSLYDRYHDPNDVLHVPWSGLNTTRLAALDTLVTRMTDSLKDSHIPFILLAVPNRMQAAFASNGEVRKGLDPSAYFSALRQIAAHTGAIYADALPYFEHVPHSERTFYTVDGHPSVGAQELMAGALVKPFLDGDVPGFSGCSVPLDKKATLQTGRLTR